MAHLAAAMQGATGKDGDAESRIYSPKRVALSRKRYIKIASALRSTWRARNS
jgi:hypothetical protein